MPADGASTVHSLQPVSVIVFPGGFNWPIWIAQDNGYFASGGIEVALTPTHFLALEIPTSGSIISNNALILPHGANLHGSDFRERQVMALRTRSRPAH
jgi:hypothetical protein